MTKVEDLRPGDRACRLNPLYWHFLTRHRERFQGSPGMAQMYRTWVWREEGHCTGVLGRVERGEVVEGGLPPQCITCG